MITPEMRRDLLRLTSKLDQEQASITASLKSLVEKNPRNFTILFEIVRSMTPGDFLAIEDKQTQLGVLGWVLDLARLQIMQHLQTECQAELDEESNP